jgi:hypothetical protein
MKSKITQWLLLLMITFFAHNVKPEEKKHYDITTTKSEYITESDMLFNALCQPIKFTRSGVRCFLRHSFSREEYAQEFLPHNFCHFIEFLEFGKNSHQNNVYLQSTIRLFCNKVKACSYVSADAFLNLIERLPKLLESYFVKKPTSLLAEAKNTIKRTLYTLFLSKFSYFKQDPDNFFDEVSGDIIEALNNTTFIQDHIDKEQLRQTLMRFLDITLNKVIWSPLDQDDVWTSVKDIASRLQSLHESTIINQDEMDDLFQSLINRFIHFLELAGSDLSLELIQKIRDDIHHAQLLFLTLEEQEEFIESKADRLRKALEVTETKILAKKRGIITDVLPKK